MQLRRQHGTLIAVLIAAIGLVVGIVSLLLLLRLQWRHGRELRRQAQEDPLTGVDNRRGFFRRVQALLDRDADAAPLHALLLFDFDHFKRINDQYGHPFGDIVLNVSLQCLGGVVGSRGQLARLGGEEFVVLCPRLGGAEALRLAEDMRTAVAALVFPDAPENLEVTISIGMALFDGTRCHDVGSWLRAADDAMYAAKARGRDQVVVAHEVEQMLQQLSATPRPAG
jgi:diguanylate cyclase (GGDEF)-like protein